MVNLRHFPRLAAGQQDDPAVHERGFGRLIRTLVRALSGWSDVPEPGVGVQA